MPLSAHVQLKTCQGWRFSGCSMHFYITLPMHNPDCSLLRLV